MAVDMFMKLNGIDGESQDAKHRGEIDVLSWSWGVNQSGGTHGGAGGRQRGRVTFKDLTFVKKVDLSSPTLVQACVQNMAIPEAKLTVRKVGKHPLEYMKIIMRGASIKGIASGGVSTGDVLTETVTVDFEEVGVLYTPQNADGSGGNEREYFCSVGRNADMD